MESDEKGAITYTTLTMPTGLATLTWWNTEAGRGYHYPPATRSSLGTAPTLSITTSLNAQAKQSLKAR
jgi:hypothetical protein